MKIIHRPLASPIARVVAVLVRVHDGSVEPVSGRVKPTRLGRVRLFVVTKRNSILQLSILVRGLFGFPKRPHKLVANHIAC